MQPNFDFVFVLGAPRSGTTLLRTLIGNHSRIADLPETPWIFGSYGPPTSLRDLKEYLMRDEHGVLPHVKGMEEADIDRAVRGFLERLFERYVSSMSAEKLLFKTPDDIIYLDQMIAIFPDAYYIHIVRDGRDVTLSTMGNFRRISVYGETTAFNCLRRWVDFERRIRARRANMSRYVSITYESLVQNTEKTMRTISDFLEVFFEDSMTEINIDGHDLPQSEVGARDVLRHGSRIRTEIGRFSRVPLTLEQKIAFNRFSAELGELGYPAVEFPVSRAQALIHKFSRALALTG